MARGAGSLTLSHKGFRVDWGQMQDSDQICMGADGYKGDQLRVVPGTCGYLCFKALRLRAC